MSYILDALRRADAERERGAVPGLHTRAVSDAGSSPDRGGRTAVPWLVGALVAVCLGLGGVLAWKLAARAPEAAVAVVPAAVVAVAPAPAAAPAAAAAASTPPGAAAPVPAAVAVAPAVAVASAVPAAPPPAQSERRPATVPALTPAQKLRELARDAAAVPETAPAAKPSAPRVYTPQELPDDIRGQLPRLAVSGATYSSNPRYRMVIVNGQVLHEGEEAAAGTALETIAPHAVVLRFRGYRYTLPY